MFQRAAMVGFSSLALVACSSGSTAGGIDAPTSSDAGTACETNPYGECYPSTDLGTNKADFGASSGARRAAGSTMRNMKWYGYRAGSFARDVANPDAPLKLVSLAELYDPKGTLGYKVIHLVASSRWCSACNQETKQFLVPNAADDKAKGIVVLQTMNDGLRQGNPATAKDIEGWALSTGIFVPNTSNAGTVSTEGTMLFHLVLDANNANLGPFFDAAAVPWNGWLDARTMEIIDYDLGFDSTGSADAKALKYVTVNPPKGQ